MSMQSIISPSPLYRHKYCQWLNNLPVPLQTEEKSPNLAGNLYLKSAYCVAFEVFYLLSDFQNLLSRHQVTLPDPKTKNNYSQQNHHSFKWQTARTETSSHFLQEKVTLINSKSWKKQCFT